MRLALLAIVVAACGGANPGVRADLPHPEVTGAVREDLDLGGGIYGQKWVPASPHAVLVIVHGLKDHSDRYAGLITHVVEAGYAVYALDLRGHGRSAGARVDVDYF